MKRNLFFIIMALLPLVASAYDAEIDGIYYNFSGDEAEVTSGWYFETVAIPESVIYDGTTYTVTSIGKNAFYASLSLTSVTIPNSVTSIGDYAFYDCRHLPFISIPNSVVTIGSDAFNCCYELTSITIPNSVISIGKRAFASCKELTSIIIPDGVTSIEENTFNGCQALTSVIIPNNVTSIDYGAFYNCQALISVTIPDCVITIANDAFFNCRSLNSVNIPNNVTTIGNSAFYNCVGLTFLSIGKSVTNIGRNAFKNCVNLTDVYCYAEEVPKTEGTVFTFNDDAPIASATLHVPAGSVEKYKATAPWNEFGNIVAMSEEYFPEGTKWTEIRLDTLKFNNWYSKVGDEWVPNFETIEYRVQGEYDGEGNPYSHDPYKCVYTNASEWTDSLTLLISEGELNGFPTGVLVTVYDNYDDLPLSPSSYPFEWEIGTMIRFKDILAANMTALFPRDLFDFGVVEEIKEAYFGGVRLLKYSDVKGVRMIQGIGVVTWNDGECIFGPLKPYDALPLPHEESRHYRSMLVHFERDGEVLYDVWPEKETATAVTYSKDQMATIILPTAPDAGKGKYYGLDRVEDNQIIFEEEKQPQAHIPYIIVPSEDFSIETSTLDLAGLSPDTVSIKGIDFIGTYTGKVLPSLGGDGGGSYYDIIDTTPDCLAEEGKAYTIGALRAYLTVNWDDPIITAAQRDQVISWKSY